MQADNQSLTDVKDFMVEMRDEWSTFHRFHDTVNFIEAKYGGKCGEKFLRTKVKITAVHKKQRQIANI